MSTVRRARVRCGLKVFEQHHLLLEAAAAQHAGSLATVCAAGTVNQAVAHTAQPAEGAAAAGGGAELQLNGHSGVLALKAL